jgi:hypothetical protein
LLKIIVGVEFELRVNVITVWIDAEGFMDPLKDLCAVHNKEKPQASTITKYDLLPFIAASW